MRTVWPLVAGLFGMFIIALQQYFCVFNETEIFLGACVSRFLEKWRREVPCFKEPSVPVSWLGWRAFLKSLFMLPHFLSPPSSCLWPGNRSHSAILKDISFPKKHVEERGGLLEELWVRIRRCILCSSFDLLKRHDTAGVHKPWRERLFLLYL